MGALLFPGQPVYYHCMSIAGELRKLANRLDVPVFAEARRQRVPLELYRFFDRVKKLSDIRTVLDVGANTGELLTAGPDELAASPTFTRGSFSRSAHPSARAGGLLGLRRLRDTARGGGARWRVPCALGHSRHTRSDWWVRSRVLECRL